MSISRLVLVLGVALHAAIAFAQGEKVLTVAEAARHMNYVPFYYAVERGFFKREGLEVKVFTANRRDLAMKAVLAGEAFASLHDPIEASLARSRGADVRIIASVVAVPLTYLVGDADLDKDPAKWGGKKVAVATPPNTNYSILIKELRESGWVEVDPTTFRRGNDQDPNKYLRLLLGAWGTEMPLVMNGQANMAIMLEPGASTLVVKSGKKVIRDYPETIGPMLFSSLQVSGETIRRDPATVQKFVSALTKGYRAAIKNPSDLVAVAAKWFPDADPEILKAAVDRFIKAKSFTSDATFSKESYQQNLYYFSLGFPGHPALGVKWDDVVDVSFASKAAAAP